MKFGRHLRSQLTPEWRHYYLDYDKLKKLLYQIVPHDWTKEDDKGGEEILLDVDKQAEFFDLLECQRRNIEGFYEYREMEVKQQFQQYLQEFESFTMIQPSIQSNRRKVEKNRKKLIQALTEFYLNVKLLKGFKELNYTGFRKITKKHDKLTETDLGGTYFKSSVCSSKFYTSKELLSLIDKIEETTILLEYGNRRRAMDKLRVPSLEEDQSSQWVSFRAGWLMGAIFIGIIIAIVTYVYRRLYLPMYENHAVLYGLRAYFMVTIWFYGFAINTYVWGRSGVNNVLIFEFNPRKYLSFQQLFEVASIMGVIFIISLIFYLFSDILGVPEFIAPLVCWVFTLVLFFLPLPILYYRSRIWLMKVLGRILLAPFFDVKFADFWIADQLNSLASVLLDVEFFICFLVYGMHASESSDVQCNSVIYGVRPLIAVMPAWWRFAQCLRRYRDTRKVHPHLVNAGKYSTSFFVVFFSSLAAGINLSQGSSSAYYTVLCIWVLSGFISSCYTFTWDIKMDWGFFERGYFPRLEYVYRYKAVYVFAVIENLVLRWAWTLNISVGAADSIPVLNSVIFRTVLTALGVFRRFFWNFFRLENEHLNNCGEFRVVRKINIRPLKIEDNPPDDGLGKTVKRKTSLIPGKKPSVAPPIMSVRRRRVSIDYKEGGVKLVAAEQLSLEPEINKTASVANGGPHETIHSIIVEMPENEDNTADQHLHSTNGSSQSNEELSNNRERNRSFRETVV